MSMRLWQMLALGCALVCCGCGSDLRRTRPGPVTSVKISPNPASVAAGDTRQFVATLTDSSGNTLKKRVVIWTTSAPNIATVDGATGRVSGVATGTATITAMSEGKAGHAALTVKTPIAAVTVKPGSANVPIGGTQQFTATMSDANGKALTGRDVSWTTSNAGIAHVDALTGVVNAMDTGAVTITATSEGKTGSAAVTVKLSVVCSGPQRLGCGLGLDQFALIQPGTFQMGSDNGTYDEKPVHSVTISRAFYMQKTEVSRGQWRAVMGTNPSYDAQCGDTCPVDYVSWNDAEAFINRLNASTPGVTYRLPTEAEWEYAARAGTTGDTYGAIDAIAWYDANSGGSPHPAGGKAANAWGLYDMFGNVAEWVSDWNGSYSNAQVTDPSGPVSGTARVKRGSSWFVGARLTRASYRVSSAPTIRFNGNGFRLVRIR